MSSKILFQDGLLFIFASSPIFILGDCICDLMKTSLAKRDLGLPQNNMKAFQHGWKGQPEDQAPQEQETHPVCKESAFLSTL